jgi:hypothetical protein
MAVDVSFIRDDMDHEDGLDNGVYLYYEWNFDNADALLDPADVPDEPEKPSIEPPAEEEIEGAKSTAESELAKQPTEFVPAESTHIDSSTTIFISDVTMSALTSSAIQIRQPVTQGGAAVVGPFELPLNLKSFGGKDLPSASTPEKVKEQYRLLKYFEKGGAINLIDEFGFDTILDASALLNLKFKPVLVIIDGPVPTGDPDTKTVYNNLYGVRLSADKQYLFVYDGYEDGVASDPIVLAANETETSSSESSGGNGSGGCNAGFGLFGLLPLAVWVVRKRMAA